MFAICKTFCILIQFKSQKNETKQEEKKRTILQLQLLIVIKIMSEMHFMKIGI